MKWNPKDIEMYLSAKEYVDTVVLPLLPVSFGEDMKQAVSMTEFVNLLGVQLERQLKGRLFMLQGFSYLRNSSEERRLKDLMYWEEKLFKEGFKHVVYITCDSDWKKTEGEMAGTLIWMPSLPLESMDENYKTSIIEDQVKQLLTILTQEWQ